MDVKRELAGLSQCAFGTMSLGALGSSKEKESFSSRDPHPARGYGLDGPMRTLKLLNENSVTEACRLRYTQRK